MNTKFGFVRLAAVTPIVSIGNPQRNVTQIISHIKSLFTSDILLFPELSITGYTCADLFFDRKLQEETYKAIEELISFSNTTAACKNLKQLIVVGAPYWAGTSIYNCAYVINDGKLLGIVPKSYIPNYNEFYERRWFKSGKGVSFAAKVGIYNAPLSSKLMFQFNEAKVHVEICEDVWVPIPPSCEAAIAGANILLNLSASNDTVSKSDYRIELIKNQSARCVAAYAYASAGPTESTTDLVFGGHNIVAENGHVLNQSHVILDAPQGLNWGQCVADVDVQKLNSDRMRMGSFDQETSDNEFVTMKFVLSEVEQNALIRNISPTPFVPEDDGKLKKRCQEIFAIQCNGLAQRLRSSKSQRVFLPFSGGLDSTLALLVIYKTFKNQLHIPTKNIHVLSMPGFGTTQKTLDNSQKLMKLLNITSETIDIREECFVHFRNNNLKPFGIDCRECEWRGGGGTRPLSSPGGAVDVFLEALTKLPPNSQDVQFENTQARIRTLTSLNRGFTVGTGDLSEMALGFCTYNGDHISNYHVNSSVPKTLVKFLIEYVAANEFEGEVGGILKDIAATTISPELLPSKTGEIEQSTEDILGPYKLHDFFLLHFVRSHFTPDKLLYLAKQAHFPYTDEVIKNTLGIFLKRFFATQFKRSCTPDGPKVGSVSLSPRGDWRMPSDVNSEIWLN